MLTTLINNFCWGFLGLNAADFRLRLIQFLWMLSNKDQRY